MNTNNKQFKQSKLLQSWLMRPCDVPDIGTKYWKWCPLKSYNTVDCFESKPAGCHYIHTPLKLFLLQDALRKGTLQSIFQSSTLRDLVAFKVSTGVTFYLMIFVWFCMYSAVSTPPNMCTKRRPNLTSSTARRPPGSPFSWVNPPQWTCARLEKTIKRSTSDEFDSFILNSKYCVRRAT